MSPKPDKIVIIIPSHIPICAITFPDGSERPASIALISLLPIIHAGIPVNNPSEQTKEVIPNTKAQIALLLALPDVG